MHELRTNYAQITHKLRKLRRNYAEITQKLRRNYANYAILHSENNYAKITQNNATSWYYYAQITQITQKLRRNYTNRAQITSGKTTGWASRDIPGYPSTSFRKWDIPG